MEGSSQTFPFPQSLFLQSPRISPSPHNIYAHANSSWGGFSAFSFCMIILVNIWDWTVWERTFFFFSRASDSVARFADNRAAPPRNGKDRISPPKKVGTLGAWCDAVQIIRYVMLCYVMMFFDPIGFGSVHWSVFIRLCFHDMYSCKFENLITFGGVFPYAWSGGKFEHELREVQYDQCSSIRHSLGCK